MSQQKFQPDSPPTELPRRGFLATLSGLTLAAGLTALAGAAGLWSFVTARLLVPNTHSGPADHFKAGHVQDYRPEMVETRYQPTHGVWIVCTRHGDRRQIVALSTTCTHLGCITLWQSSQLKFQCPCHGSRYSIDGINLEGPAPRPLERYAIRLADDGQIEVDKNRTFREERGQWSNPDSYLIV